jgi:hypothetical protein
MPPPPRDAYSGRQIVLADDLVAVADQVRQQIEHLRLQRDSLAAPPKFATRDVEHVIRRAKLQPGYRGG